MSQSNPTERSEADPSSRTADRRQRPRREFDPPLPVYDADSGVLIGEVANMTSSGLMMVMEVQLQRDDRLKVVIDLDGARDGRRTITVALKCRWSHRQVGGQLFETGCRFFRPSFRQKLLLEQYVRDEAPEFAEFSEG